MHFSHSYGSETLNLTKQQTLKVRTVQTWSRGETIKPLNNGSEKKQNYEVIMEMIAIGKVKWNWAGYVARRTGNRWKTRITFWTPRGHTLRKRWRSRTRWRDDLHSFVKQWHRVAQNIDQWTITGKAWRIFNGWDLLTDRLNDVISLNLYILHIF